MPVFSVHQQIASAGFGVSGVFDEQVISKLAKKWPKWTEISDYVRNQERLEFVSYLYAAEADFS